MSRVRSRAALSASIALLMAAVALGGLLIHDGEVGTDESRIVYMTEGDEAHLKGHLEPFLVPFDSSWDELRPVFENATYRMHLDSSTWVLVTNLGAVASSTYVVDGPIVWQGPLPGAPETELTVVRADRVVEPIIFA